MLLRDYLEREARFPSPPTSGTSKTVDTLTVTFNELDRHIAKRDFPQYAFCDDKLVDALLTELEQYLGERKITPSQEAELSGLFNPNDFISGIDPWTSNGNESRASTLVGSGPLRTLSNLLLMLDMRVAIQDAYEVPDTRLKTDYRISIIKDISSRDDELKRNKGVLVEVIAPSVVDHCDTENEEEIEEVRDKGEGGQEEIERAHNERKEVELNRIGEEEEQERGQTKEPNRQGFGNLYHEIHLRQGGSPFERIMGNVTSYMHLSKTNWATVTSHHKWVFIRRTDHPSVMLYSTVELQEGNTRPFRALMAMVLAAQGHITVPSPPQDRISIPVMPTKKRSHEDVDRSSGEHSFDNDNNGEYTSGAARRDPYRFCNTGREGGNSSYDVELRWASYVLPNGDKSFFMAVPGTSKCSTLGERTIRMQLHRFLGLGATGDVYGATLDVDGIDYTEEKNVVLSHVVKLVMKGTSPENGERVSRMRNEFAMYQKIEQARSTGYGGESIPRCYGLYESKYSLVLLLEYAGEPVQRFRQITPRGRSALLNAINFLHILGICHGDITPRNVVKGQDMSYKLIDFY